MDIAKHCAIVTGSQVGRWTINRWLRRNDIPIRSLSHACSVKFKMKPDVMKRAVEHANSIRPLSVAVCKGDSTRGSSASQMRKIQRKSVIKKKRENRETRPCAVCGLLITRACSAFRYPLERTYCSRLCLGKAIRERTLKGKAEEALTRQIIAIVGHDTRQKAE